MERGAALAELRRCAGTQFDPRLVEIFESVATREPSPGLPRPAWKATETLPVGYPALAPGMLSA